MVTTSVSKSLTAKRLGLKSLLMVNLFLAASCGNSLIDGDILGFDVSVSSKDYVVDTKSIDVDVDAVRELSCGGQPTACSDAAAAACPEGECTAVCNATSQTCDVTLYVTLSRPIELGKENPEIAQLDANRFVDVNISRVKYEVSSNTLNLAIPAVTLHVGPSTVMTPKDPAAEIVGSSKPIGAATIVPIEDITFDASGKAHLEDAMLDFKTPFSLIVSAELLVTKDTPVPQGDATVRIAIDASASL